ncbi:hypothetical protein NDU88_008227 [Pleurodeles waltl]|uniref:Uncharacterized protein n=1 Tax=Pleurodeles waltl TaxID=8319 RepID=A0AAV7SUL9_PLEWA|nr:hypothetical protein NDU88_008227 [Pleurodeles waltl]
MHRRALRVGPHKGEALLQRDALIIMARGKAPKKKHRGEEQTDVEADTPRMGVRSARHTELSEEKPTGGSPEGKQQRGNPKRERRFPKWEPAPLGTPEMKGKNNPNKAKQACALNSTTVTKHLSQ